MTFEEALKWLEEVGAQWLVGRETEDYDVVLVCVGGLRGSGPARKAWFNARLWGPAREAAIQRAVVTACERLMVGLAQPRTTDTMRDFNSFAWRFEKPQR
jgi:hypothetical protein